jgi:ABC-type lipoprotein export system ATPase subunit
MHPPFSLMSPQRLWTARMGTVLAEITKNTSRGVLVVTHDPRILPFASRIIRIEDGLIVPGERSEHRRAAAISGRREVSFGIVAQRKG